MKSKLVVIEKNNFIDKCKRSMKSIPVTLQRELDLVTPKSRPYLYKIDDIFYCVYTL